MLNYRRTLTNLRPSLIIFILPFLLSACVNWGDRTEPVTVRADITIHISVRDFITNNPIQNKVVSWSVHLYNGTTDTESNRSTGQVITDGNGSAFLPVYQCELNPSKVAIIVAYTSEQTNDDLTPITISYDDVLEEANDDNYAQLSVDYPITL